MVFSLQVLRALSATSIIVYHVLVNQYGEISAVHVLTAGVVVFFVISGYIICRSTEGTDDPLRFFVRRFLRIYPVWWAALAIWLLGERLVVGHSPSATDAALSGALVFFWNDQYQAYAPSYHIGWTLCYEVTFYAVWGASLSAAKRYRVEPILIAGALIFVLVATAAILSRTIPGAQWMKPYGSPLMLDFLAGAAIRWAESRKLLRFTSDAVRRSVAMLCAASALLGFSAIGLGLLPGWLTSIPAVLIFTAFLLCDVSNDTLSSAAGVYLGDASYSIYLFHALLLDLFFVHSGFLALGNHSVTHALAAFCACFVFAICMYHLVEQPCVALGRFLTSGWRRPKGGPTTVAQSANVPKVAPRPRFAKLQ